MLLYSAEANIALGVGLSVGLYVLVCVLVPVVAYVGFLWWKYDPFGLMFGGQEYPVSAADGNSRTWRRKTAEPTVVRAIRNIVVLSFQCCVNLIFHKLT